MSSFFNEHHTAFTSVKILCSEKVFIREMLSSALSQIDLILGREVFHVDSGGGNTDSILRLMHSVTLFQW